MKKLFTRENFSKSLDLILGAWSSYTFPEEVTDLNITITGNVLQSPLVAIELREVPNDSSINLENTFMLGIAQNFYLKGHVVKSISFRTIIGSTVNGKISLQGYKKRKYQNIGD